MIEAQYAAAPWYSTANSWQFTTVYDANGVPVCQLDLEWWDVTEENQDELEARQAEVAALIVAAPALLDALTLFMRQWNACGPNSDFGRYFANVRDEARAAIAKATGKAA